MTEQLMLWFNHKHGRFFDPEERNCASCKTNIQDIAVLRISWSRRRACHDYYCLECNRDNKVAPEHKILTYREQRLVVLMQPPKGSIMCPISKPSLTLSKHSVFDAADNDGDGAEVIDKTRYANRGSLENAQIGSVEKVKEIDNVYENATKALEAGEADRVLTTLSEAEPVIEHKKVKLIENEKEKINGQGKTKKTLPP